MSTELTEAARRWLSEERGIDVELASRYGLSSKGPGSYTRDEWVAFPYVVNGETVNHKYRTASEQDKRFSQDQGGMQPLWNCDCLKDRSLDLMPWVWTEGEIDALTAIQCDFQRTVSLPGGALAEPTRGIDDGAAKFAFLRIHAKAIRKFKDDNKARRQKGQPIVPIILAFDRDDPGVNMREEVARRIGKAFCQFVRYPKLNPRMGDRFDKAGALRTHCKDLNEVFQNWGRRGVVETLEGAKWMHVPGVRKMSEFAEKPERKVYSTGLDWLDGPGPDESSGWLKFRTGDMLVLSGIPGHGKSSLANAMTNSIVRKYGWGCGVASFEQDPATDHRAILRDWYLKKPWKEASDWELAEADSWIEEYFCFITPEDDEDGDTFEDEDRPPAHGEIEEKTDLVWLMNAISSAVFRYGIKIMIVDPWNEIDHNIPVGVSETEYIGWALKQLRRLAMRLDIFLIVVAHPKKVDPGEIPGLYSISGSSKWADKADVGVIVHLHESGMTLVDIKKVKRHGEVGKRGQIWLQFDMRSRHYAAGGNPMALQDDDGDRQGRRRRG